MTTGASISTKERPSRPAKGTGGPLRYQDVIIMSSHTTRWRPKPDSEDLRRAERRQSATACSSRATSNTTEQREVFLLARAPFGPIAPGTVASTVRRACRRAGLPEVGSHALRHTVACEMVAAQVPLTQIAQVLRHQSLQSTAIYARVDLDRLRPLAQPWPGGGLR